jgi:hypothetical protein
MTRRPLFLLALAWPIALVTPAGSSMSDSVLLAAIRLVDDHTWTLSDEPDPRVVFQTEAFDISVHGGRIYSGVAPGASLVAAPVYLVFKPVLACIGKGVVANQRFLGYYERNRREMGRPATGTLKDVYLMQILMAWLVSAPLLAALVARLAARLAAHGLARAHATAIALAVGLGSMALYYSSTYSHAALAYGLSWHAVLWLWPAPGASGPGRGACLAAGALLGAAVGIDYGCALLVLLTLAFVLPALPGAARALVAAPLVALLGLTALYHQAAFGSPFVTAYHFRFWLTPEVLARRGLDLSAFRENPALGLRAPRPDVMFHLCFGLFKGLFVYCPVLLLGLIGHLRGLRRPTCRRLHLLSLAVFAGYLVFNSTFATGASEWDSLRWGGLSEYWGPRHLLATVPFLAVGLAGLDWRRSGVRGLTGTLLLVSCALNALGAMFGDVAMFAYAFGPEMRSPLAYVLKRLWLEGPRVPLLDVYDVARPVQWLALLALMTLTAVVGRREIREDG